MLEGQILERYYFLINGKKVFSDDNYDLLNPYDLSVITKIPLGNKEIMDEAIETSKNAFELMKAMPAYQRSEILYNTALLIKSKSDLLARIITLETSKPLKASKTEVHRTYETFLFAAEEAKRINGETITMDSSSNGMNKLAFTVREPIGVVVAITPFNFPLNLVAHKVAPALASGNTVVLKPAEQTPLTSLALAELLKEAGCPDGAINVVTGEGVTLGPVVTAHPDVAKISFTGSPRVGEEIRSNAGFKKLTLELGSNAALIVDRDVTDMHSVVEKAVTGAFSFSGQVCIHTQRIYVHKEVFKEFTRLFVEETKKLKVGHPLDEDTDLSAVINPRSQQRILDWVQEAENEGGEIVTGGRAVDQTIEPTVILNTNPHSKVVCEEVFGPVVVINPVNDMKDAIAQTNNSRYGLNAGVFTRDINTAMGLAKELHVGQVLINEIPTFRVDHMPYGGVKDSGVGKEGVKYAIQEMTDEKLIIINTNY